MASSTPRVRQFRRALREAALEFSPRYWEIGDGTSPHFTIYIVVEGVRYDWSVQLIDQSVLPVTSLVTMGLEDLYLALA